mgnify:CR=1 FL=1
MKRPALLTAEGVFLLAFFGFLALRAINPDLWHPARGGEKPMDLAFFTAVLKSPAFPAYDPWFAGGVLNYYYFGFVLVGVPALLTGIAPQIAYNLAIPTIAALTALGAWGAAYNLLATRAQSISNRRRLLAQLAERRPRLPRFERRALAAGVVAALFVVLLGSLAQAIWFVPGSAEPLDPGAPPECAAALSYAAQQECKGRAEWAFWDATRLVGMALRSGEINEFPFFTFLYGDLHAHMIALPLTLAALGLMAALALPGAGTPLRRVVPFGLLALVIGSLYATNTWDYPVSLGLGVLALALPPYLRWRRGKPLGRALLEWGTTAAALVLLSSVLFQPFRSHFATDYAGFEFWVGSRTPIAAWLQINGLWIFLALSGALWLYVRAGRIAARSALILAAAYGLLALVLLLTGGDVLLFVVALVAGGVWLLVDLALRDTLPEDAGPRPAALSSATMLAALWGVAAIGILLLTEILVAKGDIGRMNTVFKLGMASWVLFGISGAIGLVRVWQGPAGRGRWVWRAIAGLLIAAALVYPLTATPARLADRYDPTLGPTLDGTAFMRSPQSSWGENGVSFTLADDAAAIEWMRANIAGTPIVLEAHAEAYRWSGRFAVYTGLPTLLGWPWHMIQQRSVAETGVVINNRQVLIRDLYSSLPLDETLHTMQRYGVEYVVVGALEAALYGDATSLRFAQLAQNGAIEEVHRSGATVIYRVPATNAIPAVVTNTRRLHAPADLPPTPAMLPVRVGELPAAHVPGWNDLARSQPVAVLLWLLCWYGLLLLGLPAALLVFGDRWPDAGFAWARLFGLLLLGYTIWLPVSGRWWSYDTNGIMIGVIFSLAVAALLLAWIGRRAGSAAALPAALAAGAAEVLRIYRVRRRRLAVIEAIFLAAFGVMIGLRALNPDLWQPIWGGEKPFEFGMLNALMRTAVLPPYSPFFSDGTLNYYYYGYFLGSLPLRITGIAPAIGYNLLVPTFYALLLSGVVSLLLRMSGRWWVALGGAAFVGILGNPASVFAVGWSRGLDPVWAALADGPGRFGERLGDWFIGPTRIIPAAAPTTINEFPYFSFLFADLHPHLIALPLTILMAAIGYTIFSEYQRSWPAAVATWGAALLTLGALAVTNSWDFPTYGLLLGGALLGRAWRRPAQSLWQRLRYLLAAVGAAGLAGIGAMLLYLPFFQNYHAMVGGVGVVAESSLLVEYLLMFGLFVAILAPVLATTAWRLIRLHERAAQRMAGRLALIALPQPPALAAGLRGIVALAIGLVALIAIIQPTLVLLTAGGAVSPSLQLVVGLVQAVFGLRLWLAALLIVGMAALLVRRTADTTWFTIWLAVVGLVVSLVFEVVYIRDHLDGGDWYRMNTVFKFGLQAWVLLALAAAAALPWALRGLRRMGPVMTLIGGGMLAGLLLLSLVYPLVGTPSRVALRFPGGSGPVTLDGLAFMETARYPLPAYITPAGSGPIMIDLRHDYAAIAWLEANLRQPKVVLQSSLEFYRAYGVRIAANTGLPTIVSPLHESEQRDGRVVGGRDGDVITIYRTPDLQEALRLLAKYRVDYLYVGAIERHAYGEAGIAKFELLVGNYLEVAYRNEEVTIYRTLPALRSVAPLLPIQPRAPADGPRLPQPDTGEPPEPAVPTSDPDLAAAEQRVADNPGAAGPAFDLALRYRAIGRSADAAVVLAVAARANPNDIGLHHLWGDILVETGQYDEAVRAYAQAVATDPSAGNYIKLAQGYAAAGEFAQAEAAYRQALATDTAAADAYYHLGALYEQAGRPGDAIDAYRRYLAIAPEGPYREAVQAALARLE